MRAYVGRRQNDWDKRLGMIEYAYNNSVHNSSGYSPFYLCYGRHPLSPVQLLSQMESKNAATDAFLRQLEEDVASALENLQRAQDRQKRYADRRGEIWNYRWGMKCCFQLPIYQFRVQQGEVPS